MGSLALICSALVATAALAVVNEVTYLEAAEVITKVLGTDFNETGDEEHERDLDYHDEYKREMLSKQRAPLVCFVRYEGFGRYGVMRFSVDSIPVEECTHVIFSYLETDNCTGGFLYPKTGPLSLKGAHLD
ncbi:hypothetical protein MRX96_005678 [Rhipicephalus microplus]